MQFFVGTPGLAVFIPKAFNKPKRRHPESLSAVAACLLYGPRAGSQRGFGAVSSTTLGFTPPDHVRCPETEPYTIGSSVLSCLQQATRSERNAWSLELHGLHGSKSGRSEHGGSGTILFFCAFLQQSRA